MKLRFPILLVAAALAASAVPPASAQNPQDMMSPPSDLVHPEHGGSTYSLDTLFCALKIAPDATSAIALSTSVTSEASR